MFNIQSKLKIFFSRTKNIPKNSNRQPIVSVINIKGRIGAEVGSTSLDSLSPSIDYAFSSPLPNAILLCVNCNGGSPAQAEMIYRRIRILADLFSIPVFASVEDVATSAGYWVTLAADVIVAQESSIVGSIGIVSYHFGFDKLLAKLGIDRRIITSGSDKAGIDPFLPMSSRSRELLAAVQSDIHDTFKNVVINRRGSKLKIPFEEISQGATWSGKLAVKLGLIDEIQDSRAFVIKRLNAIPEMRIYQEASKVTVANGGIQKTGLSYILNTILNKDLNQSLHSYLNLE